jgi:hypothetical protein
MATASKRKPKPKTGKGAKKGAAAAAKTNGGQKRSEGRKADLAMAAQIKDLRATGKTHAQIAKQLNIQQTKALFLDIVAHVKPGEKIKDLTPADVKRLRAEGLAWHTISARTFAAGADHFVSTGKVKAMFKQATGKVAQGRVASSGAKKGKTGGKKTAAKKGSRRPRSKR